MTTESRVPRALRLVLVAGAAVAIAMGCSGSGGTRGGFDNTGGSTDGGRGGSAGRGGSGGSRMGGSGGSGGTKGTAGSGGSGETGGSGGGGGSTGGSGGSSRDAGVDAPKGGSGGAPPHDAAATPDGVTLSTLTCDSPGLVWKTANKTHYTSYPVPGSEECIKYNGCFWQGKFNTCGDMLVKSKEWVMTHNIIALFPLKNYGLHNICLKSGTRTIEVTAFDTCGDSDCGGCCTANKAGADALVDVESYTDRRWGVGDGRIQWADLGYKGASCTDAP